MSPVQPLSSSPTHTPPVDRGRLRDDDGDKLVRDKPSYLACSTGEIFPGRFYTAPQLRELLPPTLCRLAVARCQMIDGVVIGQAVIEVLAKAFVVPSGIELLSGPGSETMTLTETAKYLRLSETTVRRMVSRGQLTAEDHRLPGSKKALLRFSRSQIDRDKKKAETSAVTSPASPRFKFNRV